MARHKNANWNINEKISSIAEAELATLMDIRDELKELNVILRSHNVLDGFRSMRNSYLYLRRLFPLKKPRRKKK